MFSISAATFLHLSEVKIKEGVFEGPDIRRSMKDQTYDISRKGDMYWFQRSCTNIFEEP